MNILKFCLNVMICFLFFSYVLVEEMGFIILDIVNVILKKIKMCKDNEVMGLGKIVKIMEIMNWE